MRSRAVWYGLLALLATVLAGGIWAALLLVNLATTPSLPWSAVVTAAISWILWRVLNRGRVWTELRARRVPAAIFGWAVLAGMLSIASLARIWIVLFRLAEMRGNTLPDLSTYPKLTVAILIVTASLVTAMVEEAGFRGFFQSHLERMMSGPAAVLVSALAIAPGHGLTQGFEWPTVLFYILVDGMLGTLALLTDSILPGIVVHAAGLLVFFTLVWPFDAGRGDQWLWPCAAQAIGFGALAALSFVRLARLTSRHERSGPMYNAHRRGAG